jgi:hypothetical protein
MPKSAVASETLRDAWRNLDFPAREDTRRETIARRQKLRASKCAQLITGSIT